MIPAKQKPIDTLIIDGAYLCWRSFHATPPLLSKSGIPTGAIHGFINSIRSALKETKANECIIAWEGGTGGRDQIIPGYKQDRIALPSNLGQQMQKIRTLSELMGWPVIRVEGLEADDVIYSIVLQNQTKVKAIFTTDKDIIALADETTMIYAREKGKSIYYTKEDYAEKWGVSPQYIPAVLALCGDQIDCIPGVSGIGKKTATELVRQYFTVEAIIQAADQGKLKPKVANAIITQKENLLASQKAIQLIQVKIEPPDDLKNLDEAIKQLEELDMVSTAKALKQKTDEQTQLL